MLKISSDAFKTSKQMYDDKIKEMEDKIEEAPEWKKKQLESKLSLFKKKNRPTVAYVYSRVPYKKGKK